MTHQELKNTFINNPDYDVMLVNKQYITNISKIKENVISSTEFKTIKNISLDNFIIDEINHDLKIIYIKLILTNE